MAVPDRFPITALDPEDFPALLRETSDPPERLYMRGTPPDSERIMLAVVGSRRHTSYGKSAAESLIAGLAGAPISIVSGLAIGIDGIAHRASLKAGLPTIAVPGSGLGWDVLYPRQHLGLAEAMLDAGGTLMSEYEPDFRATTWSFPKRNRIMAGMSKAVLLIEAHEKSGTLVTARLAMEENRDVLVVPGPITNDASKGTNRLLRDGATPVTSSNDILEALGLHRKDEDVRVRPDMPPEEAAVWDLLEEPMDRDIIAELLGLAPDAANRIVIEMELKGFLVSDGGFVARK